MTRVPVALSANSRFALPLAVTLHSLISTAGESTQLKIYLVGNDIHPCLARAVERRAEVTQVPLPDTDLKLPKRFSPEALAPVFLGRLLDEERILFLDSDLLILDDVLKLWRTNLQGHTLAAVQDLALPWRENGSSYFNCGILLLDLEKFRAERGEERALNLIRRNPTRFLHQTAFNALYRDSWFALDLRWNLIGGLCGRPFTPRNIPGLESAIRDPGIIHFAGRFKPWRFRTAGCFEARYQALLKQKPFGFEKPVPVWRERLLSFYDRYLRVTLYPVERFLWSREVV